MTVSDDIGRQLAQELETAKSRREQTEIISSYQALNGCSRNTILRAARRWGWRGKKTRMDKGKLKANLSEEQITKLVQIYMGTRDKKYKVPIMPLKCVIRTAEDQGIIPPDEISPHQLGRLLKELGLGRKDLRAEKDKGEPIRLKAEHPNDVWFFDTTWGGMVYVKNDRELGYQCPTTEDYRNKEGPGRRQPKIFLYMVVDYASGAVFCKYYEGESVRNMADFIYEAFSSKPDGNREPMRGLPKILFGDKGSVNRSGPIQGMLKRLNIKWLDHMVGNPRAKGPVEKKLWDLKRIFETRLMLQPARTLEELNDWLLLERQHLNSVEIMGRHGMTRAQAWNTIAEENLILPPDYEIYQKLLQATTVSRLVHRGRFIMFESDKYQIGGNNPTKEQIALVGEKVEVGRSPWKWREDNRVVEIITPNGIIYEVEPMKATIYGFPADAATIGKEFKSNPDTKTQRELKKRMIIDGKGQLIPAKAIAEALDFRANIFHVNKERFPDNVRLMPKKGSSIVIETMERKMPRIQGLMELSRMLERKFSPEESQALLARMDKEVSDKDIRAMAKELKGEAIGIAAEKSIG